MVENKELIQVRKRKPHFVTKDTHKKARVPARWRKPRGRHSPVRQQHKGRPKLVSIGYGSAKQVRHLHSSGLKKVIVQQLQQLAGLDPQTQGIIISGQVGKKRKTELIKAALEQKLTILNLKDAQKSLATLEEQFKARQESKKKKLTEKEKKELEKKKQAEEKEKKDKAEQQEKPAELKEKKEEEKKEAEKMIIKKQ